MSFSIGQVVIDFIGKSKVTIVENDPREPKRWIVVNSRGYKYSAHELDLGNT